ncbi:polyprenyl synthetase family protein [Marinicella litoralis]|uniref:Farnesyl-diphosphate synthase n=1 Tax=Marinicella litoralis TaxID=644220 RepID=A0A4R6XWJ2_9GAMM|nr:farnesyl diphosphate synthase [Marinicella litoralis]TDR22820.1 farnesyl-diphosphate synthase [Marinicella litoralis]
MLHYQNRINSFLSKQIEASSNENSRLKQSMQYSLLSGGKRIRPLLVYATAESLKINLDTADYIAAAIEMIHAYSLIHDDLPAMDNDDLRRGKATNHIKFDEATAILAGDALQSLAYETLANTPADAPNVVAMIAKLAQLSGIVGMAGGQSLDLMAENKNIGMADLQKIHAAKTGALLQACVQLTTELKNNLADDCKIKYHLFAEHLGVAFQIVDDILDVTQDTETLGKPANSDTKNKKATYPSLLGLQNAKDQADHHINKAYHLLENIEFNTDMLKQLTALILQRNH